MEIVTLGDVFITVKIGSFFGKGKILLYHVKTRMWCNGDTIYSSDMLEKMLLRKLNETIVRSDLAKYMKNTLP